MNNNLPEDIQNLQNQTKVDDTSLNASENSNLLATAVAATQEMNDADTDVDEYEKPNEDDVTFELSALENIIRQKLSIIEKSQIEVSELRTQLNDMMANSEEYYKADKASKEAQKQKKQVKATIMGTQEAKMLQGKFDEARQELKENQEALSEFLLDFYEKMHVKEIDDMEGKPRDLVIKVSVAPPKNI